MISREALLQLNNSGLSSQLQNVQKAVLLQVLSKLAGEEREEPTQQQKDNMLLNAVGPAAASAVIEMAINHSRKTGVLTKNYQFNGNVYNNLKLIQNDNEDVGGGTGYQTFSSVLRQFLLPRYAYLDFDRVVDPRHLVDTECGYPKWITPIMYRYMYDRDDVARRVVDIYPDESWAADPDVYEDEDEENETPFEEDWRMLCEDYNVLQYLYRADKLCGIGHYGVLLYGLEGDSGDLDKPLDEPELIAGKRKTVGTKKREILYFRPFDEYLSFILQYDTDQASPRYGKPIFYNLVFVDMTIDAGGASIGTRLNRRVHWSRLVHITDNPQGAGVFGTPRQQSVFNRELDLRKMKGGMAESVWTSGFPGISWELDPQYVADNPEFDKEAFKDSIEQFRFGLQRDIFNIGIKANQLNPMMMDNPQAYIDIQIQAIASNIGTPIRIFSGSEDSKIASPHDLLTWNKRLGRRLKRFVEPDVIRNFIDRMIAIGVMRPPKSGRYFVGWPDLNATTDEDRANLSLKNTQALSQYVASGVIHMVPPLDYFTMFMGMKPRDAIRLDKKIKSSGGYEKLAKVDPSQGEGENGVRKNTTTKGERNTTGGERPAKRQTADKKAEGSAS